MNRNISRRQAMAGLAMAAAVLVLPLSGCDTIKGLGAIRDDVKSELGVDALVNIQIRNGTKSVNVTLQSTPKGDAKEVKAKVENIVNRHITGVDNVTISM